MVWATIRGMLNKDEELPPLPSRVTTSVSVTDAELVGIDIMDDGVELSSDGNVTLNLGRARIWDHEDLVLDRWDVVDGLGKPTPYCVFVTDGFSYLCRQSEFLTTVSTINWGMEYEGLKSVERVVNGRTYEHLLHLPFMDVRCIHEDESWQQHAGVWRHEGDNEDRYLFRIVREGFYVEETEGLLLAEPLTLGGGTTI